MFQTDYLYSFSASATVVPSLTTIASKFGSHSQKGVVLGIFRSLGSLARAFGPMVFALGKYFYLLSVIILICMNIIDIFIFDFCIVLIVINLIINHCFPLKIKPDLILIFAPKIPLNLIFERVFFFFLLEPQFAFIHL